MELLDRLLRTLALRPYVFLFLLVYFWTAIGTLAGVLLRDPTRAGEPTHRPGRR